MSRIEYPASWSTNDCIALDELFTRARTEGLWFHGRHQDLWLSPDELQAEQKKGQYLWGAVNWELRNPVEMVEAAKAKVFSAEKELKEARSRVFGPNKGTSIR